MADGLLFVVSDRLYAFSTSCPHPRACPPVWSANVGPATGSNAPAAGDDTVVVATDRVYAFDAHCAARDGACVPSWSYTPPDDTPLSSPGISDGVALVGGSRVRAFSLACNAKAFWAKSSQTRSLHWIVARTHETCRPIWEGPISRTGAFSQPVTAQGMVFGSADRVYAFPHMCELACHPLWTSPALGAGTTTPAVGMDRLFVTTSLGTLYAFTLDRAAGS